MARHTFFLTASLLLGAASSLHAQTGPRLPLIPQQGPVTLTLAPPPLRGFVDLHTHPVSNLGFSGKLIFGGEDATALMAVDSNCKQHQNTSGEAAALGHDAAAHGAPTQASCGDFLRPTIIHFYESAVKGAAVNDSAGSSDAHGFPDFKDWPVWNDVAHQKMWVEWIRRSWVGGLRVMVALAVNNKTLADTVAGSGDGPADDKSSADLQIAELTAFVARHSDFMEIAKTSADVQRIVSANRLAVILGVEIDHLGNFGQTINSLIVPNPPTAAQVTAEIDRLWGEGVRYAFPVHVLDNLFGATAAYEDMFEISNFRETGHFWNLQCAAPGDNITYHLDMGSTGTIAAMLGASFKVQIAVPFSGVQVPSCPAGIGFRNLGAPAVVNGKTVFPGLTSLGHVALKEMMRLGMLIDVDHMSQNTIDSTLDFAEQVLPNSTKLGYPLMSGHSHVRGGLPGASTSERDLTATQYARLAGLHGMMGVGSAGLDAWQWLNLYNTTISPFPGVVGGFGTDTNGLAIAMPPRIGKVTTTLPNSGGMNNCLSLCKQSFCDTNLQNKYICRQPAEQNCENQCNATIPPTVTTCTNCTLPPAPAVVYDASFPASTEGTRTWNYNTEGVVHYGMLPDFLRDVASLPGGANMVNNNFMNGADYFYHTWQIAESKAALANQIPLP
ncbi:MAG TPA: hypothetical protein VGM84_14225 [Steroidobacteraceae bacterium]